MQILIVLFICLAVAVPFTAFAWALRRRECPHCGQAIDPDPELMRIFAGD